MPAEVVQEILVGGPTHFACVEFAAATWLDRQTLPTPLSSYLLSTLDRGEAAVIAFALTGGITTVCIDETVGRRVARLHGLGLTGSLGILIQARQKGLNVSVRTSVARMRKHGIWLSPTVEAEALRLAGE